MNWTDLINSNLLGSLIGTLLAGYIAIKVMQHQIKYDRNIRKKEEVELFLKVNTEFEAYIKAALEQYNSIIDSINFINSRGKVVIDENSEKEFIAKTKILEQILLNVDQLDKYAVPFEIYRMYIGIREQNKITFLTLKTELEHNLKKGVNTEHIYMSGSTNNFEKEIKALKNMCDEIEMFRESTEDKLQELKSELNSIGFFKNRN